MKRKKWISCVIVLVIVMQLIMPVSAHEAKGGEEENTIVEELPEENESPEELPGENGDSAKLPEENGDSVKLPEENENPAEAAEEGEELLEDEDEPQLLAEETEQKEFPEVSYRVHVQTFGWQDWKKAGETAGTTSQSKRLEAIELKVSSSEYEGGIEYCAHVQSYGWQEAKHDGELCGTSGESKRLEAIEIRLTGELAEHYDIYYHVHVQSFGWLGWAKNGENAGSSSYGKRLEAIEIQIVEKDMPAPGSTERSYLAPQIAYQTHVQSYGWQDKKFDGELSGTTGKSKRLEGIKISLHEPKYSGGIRYRTHVQNLGWQDWKYDGQLSGTAGQAKRLEAIQIELTGEISNYYDVYYRVHSQTKGWMSWACNGKSAGTEGFAKRLESIEIKLVEKEDPNKPDISGQSYIRKYTDTEISFFGYVGEVGEITAASNGAVLGTTGKSMRLEGMGIHLDQSSGEVLSGAIQYRTHCQSYGWLNWTDQEGYSGTKDEGKRMEAIQIRLTGEMSRYYDIYYRTHVQTYGWLGWTRNGSIAGTTDISHRIEAVQIQLVVKNESGPAMNQASYRTVVNVPAQSGSGLTTIGSYKMSDSVRNELSRAIGNFAGSGNRVGFYMIDLHNGQGICYNSNDSFYSASAIKGPYVVSLNEKVPSSPIQSEWAMRSTIKVSDNNAYEQLRRTYGGAPFAAWCNEAGCTGIETNRYYTAITSRQLAQLWTKTYEFFNSGRPNSAFCRELFTNTFNSSISSTLGGRYTVYSKAGWIGNGGYNNVQNDAGIVMRNGHPYVVVILSSAYGRLNYMNTLVSAIDAAHEEIIRNN